MNRDYCFELLSSFVCSISQSIWHAIAELVVAMGSTGFEGEDAFLSERGNISQPFLTDWLICKELLELEANRNIS